MRSLDNANIREAKRASDTGIYW